MQHGEISSAISISTFFEVLRRRLWLVLFTTIAVTSGAMALAMVLPKRYHAQTLIVAESAPARDYLKLKGTPDQLRIQEQLRLIREYVYRPALLEKIMRDFSLYPAAIGSAESRQLEEMKERIEIQVEGYDAFYIGFDGDDGVLVMNVANRLGEEFIQAVSASRELQVEQAAGFLGGELDLLRARLQSQSAKIKQYKESVITELPEHLSANLKLLETIEARLHAAGESIMKDQAQRVALQNELRELQRQGAMEGQAVLQEQSASQKKLEDLRLELKSLRTRYTEDWPEVVRVKGEIKELEQAGLSAPSTARSQPSPLYLRYLQAQSDLDAIDQRLKSSKAEQSNLNAQLDTYRRRVQSAPSHEKALADMIRDYNDTLNQYQALQVKHEDATLVERLGKLEMNVLWRIAEPARLPAGAEFPKRHRFLIAGAAAGLIFGFGLAFLLENLDTTFEDAEEFQRFTNLTVLSVIPKMVLKSGRWRPWKRKRSKGAPVIPPRGTFTGRPGFRFRSGTEHLEKHLPTVDTAPSIAAEQYNLLATKVRWQIGENGGKLLVITSAAGGEGKSLTSINLSMALSSTLEGRVLLIDADLRKPRVHEYLGLKPGRCFDDLLANTNVPLEECVNSVRSLHLMLGRRSIANPVHVLASRRMHEILAALRQRYRLIVLDSPPILPMADSHILAGLSDGVILVVRARHTRRELFQHAVESFHAPNILGVVLNDVDINHTRYAYAYRYYQKTYATKTSA